MLTRTVLNLAKNTNINDDKHYLLSACSIHVRLSKMHTEVFKCLSFTNISLYHLVVALSDWGRSDCQHFKVPFTHFVTFISTPY